MDDKDQVLKVLGQRFLRRINFTFQGGRRRRHGDE